MAMPLPLEGVRILAISQYGAGPFGTMHLADLGAEVIKIEDPGSGGDVGRYVPPYADSGDSLFFQALNRNTKSITLHLRSELGQQVLHALAAKADAVFSNLRGDQPDKLGLTYEHLRHANPRIVCCSLTGYGRTGPRASEPAYDYLIQGEVGIMAITGEPGSPPTRCGLSIIDFVGGLNSAIALLAGIIAARARGTGFDIDVTLQASGYDLLNYLAAWTLNRGYTPQRMPDSAHPSLVPSQNFATKDGYIVVMCNKEKFWKNLCDVLGADALLADPRFKDFAARAEHREELIAQLKPIFRARTTEEWLTVLRGRVPVAPINDIAGALQAAKDTDLLVTVEHPTYGTLWEVSSPFRIHGADIRYQHAPSLGEHTVHVLTAIAGLGEAEINALREQRVV